MKAQRFFFTAPSIQLSDADEARAVSAAQSVLDSGGDVKAADYAAYMAATTGWFSRPDDPGTLMVDGIEYVCGEAVL